MKKMTRNAAVALTAAGLLTAPLAFAQEEGDEPQGEETQGMQGMEGMEGMEGMQGGMGMMPMMAQMNEMMETCTKMMQAQMDDEGEEEKDI